MVHCPKDNEALFCKILLSTSPFLENLPQFRDNFLRKHQKLYFYIYFIYEDLNRPFYYTMITTKL